jgi:hypothetical protein
LVQNKKPQDWHENKAATMEDGRLCFGAAVFPTSTSAPDIRQNQDHPTRRLQRFAVDHLRRLETRQSPPAIVFATNAGRRRRCPRVAVTQHGHCPGLGKADIQHGVRAGPQVAGSRHFSRLGRVGQSKSYPFLVARGNARVFFGVVRSYQQAALPRVQLRGLPANLQRHRILPSRRRRDERVVCPWAQKEGKTVLADATRARS